MLSIKMSFVLTKQVVPKHCWGCSICCQSSKQPAPANFFMEKMCDQQRKLAATQILTWRETRVGKVGEYVCTFTLKGHL